MSQERFTTSRELYHRIRWDPRLDAREFVVGYDAHRGPGALEEMPFEAFVPDGEIPWHRVWYFKRGHQVVWDRKERLDLLSTNNTGSAEAAAPHRPVSVPGFTPLPAYRYDARSGSWAEAPRDLGHTLPTPASLTVATFNVLFDLYDAELLATERRTPAALALLRETDADLIALQEVTAPFLRALLAEPWVRERYWLSDGPGANTVETYGQVLLSRLPLASVWQRVFSRDKRIIAAELRLSGGPLWVATPHLTSNRDAAGASARAVQVQALLEWARALGATGDTEAPDLVLAGDFNFGDGEPEVDVFARAGFVDAWTALRPSEAGETFNPQLNSLAALTTVSGRLRRLDRVLVASASERLAPRSIGLFAEAPLDGPPAPTGKALFASDHFGLCCVLHREAGASPVALASPTSAALVHHTALVLIPPEDVWAPIQALRKKHDSKFQRWMPHITLLYPFVPEEDFETVEALLADALQGIEPFDVTLSAFGLFEHRANATAWLRPDAQPADALAALHAKLVAALPECSASAHGGFTPHLSVGQLALSPDEDPARTLAGWQRSWRPLKFAVGELCLIRRKGDTPFEVLRRIPLPGSTPRAREAAPEHEDTPLREVLASLGAGSSREGRAARTAAVEQLRKHCERVGTSLHPYGSYLLGTDGAGSDVDAVAIGPANLSREDFARSLLQELAASSASSARYVADAAIPLVKVSLGGVSFDLAYASRPEGSPPEEDPLILLERHGSQLDPAGLRSVLGLADTLGLLEVIAREGGRTERFHALLLAVKAWARARGLYSHALGYLGGLSWTLLAAWACTRAAPDVMTSDASLLAHFFRSFASWPWPQPVTLTPETARYRPEGKRDLLPVIAPALPARNTARNVSRSTFRVLQEELLRAGELVARARASRTPEAWAALFHPVDANHDLPTRLRLSVDGPTPEAREVVAGWLLGHLTALVYRLEGDRRLAVRPLQAPNASGSLLIGLEAREAAALSWQPHGPLFEAVEAFRLSFQEWTHRPEGTALRVEWMRGNDRSPSDASTP
ncbi:RNA repair domain-containing protein [Corallococcus sp. bb12-1]|uniref:poly(A) polymerase n=1 Tax=Corallococcus sp. bb12-1 TaxID=2996784 RepID=UPI00227040B3|nr:poly(A) polymerase [Corallococcus sp. bb12-1]MCY1041859.1 RNA repair domain-containing protein [Corallococcus sp. bb12-1]